jgi:hypothetical protein
MMRQKNSNGNQYAFTKTARPHQQLSLLQYCQLDISPFSDKQIQKERYSKKFNSKKQKQLMQHMNFHYNNLPRNNRSLVLVILVVKCINAEFTHSFELFGICSSHLLNHHLGIANNDSIIYYF